MTDHTLITTHDRRPTTHVTIWLLLCLALVAGMVFVGGYTRLSGSGMSITEWKPIHGVIPPLNEAEWQEEFDKYRQIPQYQLINKGMSLDEFKAIFWPEFWHRILGRAIGLAFFLPLVFFTLTKSITRPFALRLFAIFSLGGLQGFIGWYMVSSGLVHNTHVSHLRLALHLSIAFAIFGLILWAIMDGVEGLRLKVESKKTPSTFNLQLSTYLLWFTLLCLQIIYGAFMAGLHAGLLYNTWPSMNGEFLPADAWNISLGAINLLENHSLVQFIHRKLAIILALGFISWWFINRNYVSQNKLTVYCASVASVLAVQFIVGVLTLINAVPLPLALMHQMLALVLFASAVVLLHRLRIYEVRG